MKKEKITRVVALLLCLAAPARGIGGRSLGLVIIRREHLLPAAGELHPWRVLAGGNAEERDYLLISGTDD
ncbi:MAG: hypothetical protein V1789_01895 [PVC group bacterium]